MSTLATLCLLVLAAGLEAGGDAIIRLGLHSARMPARLACFAMAAVVLFGYGLTVNAPPWAFGRLLGIYVTLFFVVAQGIDYAVFGQRPDASVLLGGALIVAGGMVMTMWRP